MIATLTTSDYLPTSPEEIVALYTRRHLSRGPLISAMERVRDAYNGDIVIPLPELNKSESPSVPNLVAQGLDQTAMRVAAILPNIYHHPDRIGFKKWEEIARQRRLVNFSWWEASNMALKMRRRARWLLGYACSPALIRPSARLECPEWHVRNPLGTFPAPTDDPDSITPPNCIFAHSRSVEYIARRYGQQYATLRRYPETNSDDLLTILEYVDDRQITTLCLSNQRSSSPYSVIDATIPYSTTPAIRRSPSSALQRAIGTEDCFVISSIPNRAEICPAVVPGRITLDREQGQYDGIVGMYQTMAMLFALETRAVIQGVWPDTYVVARQNETAEVIVEADGRAGIIGKIQGGEIKQLVENPGYMTNPTLDRLEAYQRTTAGIPADFGGQSQSNVRTGRRGQDIISAAVDFPIQEAQVLFERSLMEENVRAVEIDKAYFGTMRKSIYVSWRGATGPVEYTPNDLWTSTRNTVSYSVPGTDVNTLTVLMGQKRGLELISKRTALEMDPQIEDAETELDRITAEKAEDALWVWVQTQIAQGTFTAEDVTMLVTLISTNAKSPAEAVLAVQRAAQARQSPQTGPPVLPSDPAAQPGVSPPGMGAEAGVTVPPATPSLQNLRGVLASLYPSQRGIQQAS